MKNVVQWTALLGDFNDTDMLLSAKPNDLTLSMYVMYT